MKNKHFVFGIIAILAAISFASFSYAQDVPAAAPASAPADPCADVKAPQPPPKDGQDDSAGKGLGGTCKNIDSLVKEIIDQAAFARQEQLNMNHPDKDLLSSLETYRKWRPTCLNNQAMAAKACLEGWSDDIIDTTTALNMMLGTVSASSVKDSCSTWGKAMDLAQKGLTAYSTACGTMKAGCGATCLTASSGLKGMRKAIAVQVTCSPTATDPYLVAEQNAKCAMYISNIESLRKSLAAALSEEENKATKESVAGKLGLCVQKYAALLTSVATGMVSLAQSGKDGKSCDAASNGTGITGMEEKCKNAANASLPECICLANPRTPGCANSYQKVGEASAGQVSTGLTDAANLDPNREVANFGGEGIGGVEQASGNADGGSGMAGAPTGGGGGAGLGGGSGVGGGSANGEVSSKAGLNANILGGAGGGGGGNSWKSFGGGGGPSADGKYRAYLPGGDKDPNKGVAGQQAWKNEVTGQGGKSNWEKIRERYRDNKGSLLNN